MRLLMDTKENNRWKTWQNIQVKKSEWLWQQYGVSTKYIFSKNINVNTIYWVMIDCPVPVGVLINTVSKILARLGGGGDSTNTGIIRTIIRVNPIVETGNHPPFTFRYLKLNYWISWSMFKHSSKSFHGNHIWSLYAPIHMKSWQIVKLGKFGICLIICLKTYSWPKGKLDQHCSKSLP